MALTRETAQQRWGNELRAALKAVGVDAKEVAKAVHVAPSTFTNWMQGRHAPDVKDVEAVERELKKRGPGYPEGYLKRLLRNWVPLEDSPEWSEWMEVERQAAELLNLETTLVPGLLQTEAYARVVLPSEGKVEQRIRRRKIFDENPPYCEFLIDESVLYRMVGGPEVMAEQLRHLIEMAQYSDVLIRIFRLNSGATEKFTGTFVLATIDSGKQVAGIDGALRWQIVERPKDIVELRRTWGWFAAQALSPKDSMDLIQKVLEERWGLLE